MIAILATILPLMASAADARQLVNKVLRNNKMEINRLKREIGQAYRVSSLFYCLVIEIVNREWICYFR
jgi:hypothetical protein